MISCRNINAVYVLENITSPPQPPQTQLRNRAAIVQLVKRVATGWKVRESNPDGGNFFRPRPDLSGGPFSLPYKRYRVSLPGVKLPGRGVNHPPPPSAEVKERVELYVYSISESPWPVIG